MPEHPTKDDAKAALDFLMEPLQYMPFEDEASRAVIASGFLSVLARNALDNVPLHGIGATAPASGKTLLVDCISLVATGEISEPMTIFENDEENAKGLGALLRQGAAIISYDNINLPLGFPMLEKALTSKRPQARILGVSETATTTNNAVIFANGNGFSVKGDMPRRTLRAALNPAVEHPELREFPFHPLDKYRAERPRYVVAALTILRAYILAGCPDRPGEFGSFEKWSDLIRGALMWLGCGDPCATQSAMMSEDDEQAKFDNLLATWEACQFKPSEITTRGMIQAITGAETTAEHRAFGDAIKEVAGNAKHGNVDMKAFGEYLAQHKGRIINGRYIEACGIRDGQRKWKLRAKRARAV